MQKSKPLAPSAASDEGHKDVGAKATKSTAHTAPHAAVPHKTAPHTAQVEHLDDHYYRPAGV